MADDISIKVGLQGEKEFKQALSDINAGLKTNKSELEKIQAQYKNTEKTMGSLSAKHEALGKIIASQKDKVAALANQLKASATQFGESSKRTVELQGKLNKATAELYAMESQLAETAGAMQELADAEQLGTKDFEQNIAKINSELKVNKSELEAVQAQYKNSGNSIDALSAKHETFGKIVAAQKNKVEELTKHLQRAAKQFGENGEYTADLRVELNKATAELYAMESQLLDTESAMQELADAERDAVDQAGKLNHTRFDRFKQSIDSISQKIKTTGERMKALGGNMTRYITAPVTAGFAALTKGTEEFRSDLSKLENNARLSGVGMNTLHESMSNLNAITGETDSNVEGLSNLLQAGFRDNQLQQAVEALSGAVLKFPDTLKIESLADSLQETIATGEATGQFAELLDRLGINSEKFADGLKLAAKSGREQQYVLDTLSKTSLPEAARAYMENNKALVEGRKSAYDLQVQLAELGEKVQPLVTKLTEFAIKLLDAFNGLDSETQNLIIGLIGIAAVAGPVISGLGSLATGISSITSLFSAAPVAIGGTGTALTALSNPIGLAVIAIGSLVAALISAYRENENFRTSVDSAFEKIEARMKQSNKWIKSVFARDWSESFGAFGEQMNAFAKSAADHHTAVVREFQGILDFIKGVFQGDWEKAWDGVKESFRGTWDKMVAIVKSPLNGMIGMINGLIDGINEMIDGLNDFRIDIPNWVPGIGGRTFRIDIPKIPEIQYLYKGTDSARRGLAMVGERGPELVAFSGGERVFNAAQTRSMLSGGAGRSVQIGTLAINPTAAQWEQLMQMLAQWNGLTQKGRVM